MYKCSNLWVYIDFITEVGFNIPDRYYNKYPQLSCHSQDQEYKNVFLSEPLHCTIILLKSGYSFLRHSGQMPWVNCTPAFSSICCPTTCQHPFSSRIFLQFEHIGINPLRLLISVSAFVNSRLIFWWCIYLNGLFWCYFLYLWIVGIRWSLSFCYCIIK